MFKPSNYISAGGNSSKEIVKWAVFWIFYAAMSVNLRSDDVNRTLAAVVSGLAGMCGYFSMSYIIQLSKNNDRK